MESTALQRCTAAGKRKLDYVKCHRCRIDKKKCLPIERIWPDKCERCREIGEECSEGKRKVRKKRNAHQQDAGVSRGLAGEIEPPAQWPDADLSTQPSVPMGMMGQVASECEWAATPAHRNIHTSLISTNAGLQLSVSQDPRDDLPGVPHSNPVEDSPNHAGITADGEGTADVLLEDWLLIAAFYKMMLMATEHLRNLFKKACKMMREDDYRKFVQFKFADGDSMSSFESFVDGLDDVLLKKMNQILATSDRQVSSIMVEAMGEYFMSPSRGLSDPAKCKICLDVNLAPVQDDIRSITAARLFLVQSGEWLHHLEHSQTDKVHRRCYCARIDEYKSLASEIAETARSLLKTEFTEHCVPRSVWEYSIFVPDGLYCYHTALSLNSEVTDCLGRTSLHRLLDSAPSEPYIDDLPVKDVADLQDIMGRTALYIACAKGFRDIACRLLEKGADPLEEDFFHLSPFSVAAAAGFPPICKEVLNKRKIPADGIVDSLTFCLNNDEITTYQLLVTYEQFTPTEEERRLHLVKAAEYGSNQILQKLLDEFEDPNINPYGVGRTALTCAAFKKQHAAMEIILRHKDIDVNTKDYCGKTALILAAEVGFTRGVESLTNHPDVDVNARDDFGRTPFIIAAINGHYSVVRYLLQDVRVDTGLTGRNYSGSQTKFRNGLEDPEFFDHIVRTGRRTE